ncbi:MAG: 16S rRNA (adenine(1518)-N(6)/adenine(1519)-N(6))-dimethyltransferase RsmA [Myxococcota bacterium]|nr:16S rRNA (adenine(1518)-N(6)/adenine(1519)-N(6))-dimethyltransferase RsmA [Myxococcota bacterium]
MEHPAHLLRQLEHRHARKRFGQHFLASEGVLRRIVAEAGVGPGDKVVEIGPGLGALTECLLEAGCEVLAVEIDRDLAAFLRERLGGRSGFTLLEKDAMALDWAQVLPGEDWSCVANLPYNVGTPLVTGLLRHPGRVRQLVVMLQKEVAERMVAPAGHRKRGSLSVYCESRAPGRVVVKVPPGAFLPPPKVASAVVRLTLRNAPETGGVDPELFEQVVRTAFKAPRKTLRRTLGDRFGRAAAVDACRAASVDDGARPSTLDLAAWGRIASGLVG